MKSLISAAHGPLISVVAGVAVVAGAAVVVEGVLVVELLELEPPPKMPVMALPAAWPTADPTATPPAVAAICNKVGELEYEIGNILIM